MAGLTSWGWFFSKREHQRNNPISNNLITLNMSKVNVSAQHIAALKPMEVVKDDLVRQRFIDLYGALWGEKNAEATYEREAIHFNRLLADSTNLKACTPISIFIAFIDLAVCGLSVEPGASALA